MHKFIKPSAAIGLAAVMSQSAMAGEPEARFPVKQPEEPWFQTEWKFADKAGKDLGFEVIKIAVPDGENIERYRQPGCQWRRERFLLFVLRPRNSALPSWRKRVATI